MTSLKNIAVVGGTGDLGKYLVNSLASNPDFTITVFTRGGSNTPPLPAGVKTAVVDYGDISTVVSALKGQDAVVSVVPGQYTELQLLLIEASIQAGVRRFIPSEFGSNNRNTKARTIPLLRTKVEVDEVLKQKAKDGTLSYTAIIGGPFTQWMFTYERMMPISQRKFVVHDDGDMEFSMTRKEDYGTAVLESLKREKETENLTVQIASVVTTQNRLLKLAKEALPNENWEIERVDTEQVYRVAEGRMFKGEFDIEVISGIIFKTVFAEGYGGKIEGIHNELLGIKTLRDEDLKKMIASFA